MLRGHPLFQLAYAASTLYNEIAGFRFDYPLRIVPEAGPRESLYYYLYRYKPTSPSQQVMRLDREGIARVYGRVTGIVYRPAFVGMYGLYNLNKYLQSRNSICLDTFLHQVRWLEENAVVRSDGAVVWPHMFDQPEGSLILKAPWLSANAQGFAMSALVRGWRITRRPRLMELLHGSARVFELDWSKNGVRIESERHIVYTETPGLPAPGIMDGFMRSLFGLYDLYAETNSPRVKDLFDEGVKGLRYFLPRWDYKQKWTYYANQEYLSPPAYHTLNRMLLACLGRLTGDPSFLYFSDVWSPSRLTPLDKAEIFSRFIFTKNACRIRYRTWQHKPSASMAHA